MAKDLFEFLRRSRELCLPDPQESSSPLTQVEEEFPLEEVYYAKTYTFRLDTLVAFGIFFAFLLLTTFFLGRLSVSPTQVVAKQEPSSSRKSAQTSSSPPLALTSRKREASSRKGREVTEKKPEEKQEPQKVAQGKYALQVLSSPTKKGAEEVVAFLKEQGFEHTYVVQRGRHYMVRIGGFDKKDEKTLQKVRNLRYRGRAWFDSAYYLRTKKKQG